jgi:signal transduction histidine kinase
VSVRLALRWKIMLITVVPLVTLSLAALWMVNRRLTDQAHATLDDDLRRASAVLENLLTASGQSLGVTSQVIVQDPKFFSVLTIPGGWDDPQLRATVSGVARDFNAVTQSDLFEVVDGQGRLVAAVGRDLSGAHARTPLVREALGGRPVTAVLASDDAHHLVSVAPVFVSGRVVGALLLGARIGGDLADRLRQLTRSEVTFMSNATITGSTLEEIGDRDALREAVAGLQTRGRGDARGASIVEVRSARHTYLTIVRPLPRAGPTPGQRYVIQRSLDAETAFLRDIQKSLVELGVIAVLVALVAGFLIAERITSPVQRLVRGAEEMERGNFDYPIDVRSRDEIGALAASFDGMRRRQRQYIHSLEEVARVKSEFLSVCSHELRTPISVLRGYHELMLDGKIGELNPQMRRALEAGERSLDTLTRVAENATRVAHIEGDRLVLARDDHDVDQMVDEAIAAARALGAGRRVRIERQVADAGCARVDGPRVTQALAQLVGNGIRFTPDGGEVEVRAAWEGARLVFRVRDSGIGIDPARQARLFEGAFMMRDALHHHSSSTLEFNSAGLGLGLSIARGVAEAHGGHLSVESAPGAGSTFTLSVPAERGGAIARAA